MTRKLCLALSVAGHPLLMTTVVFATILYLVPELVGNISLTLRLYIIGMFALLTFVMPLINIIILRYSSNISDFVLEDKKERTLPYIFTLIFYGTTAYFIVYQMELGNYLTIIFLSIFFSLLLVMIINLFWKISAHAVGVWGATGIIMALHIKSTDGPLFWALLAIILLSGAVSSARLYLGAHSPAQVYAGGVLGFVICFFPVWLLF